MTTISKSPNRPSTLSVALAFAAIYFVWGSTYLAIGFAVKTIPPFLMASSRFLVSGSMLFAWSRFYKGAAKPTFAHWRTTAIIGVLLLCGGNGGVVWAEQRVPSGLAALLVATLPMWIAILEWIRPGGKRPGRWMVIGVIMGFIGLVILASPKDILGAKAIDPVGTIVLTMASLSWAIGSIYSRHVKLPESALLTTSMQMLAGCIGLAILGTVTGEWSQLHIEKISTRSALSLLYLILAGSLIGFTAYTWLLKVSTPSKVATYAYVNPVVAIALGWLIDNEPIGPRTIIAATIIILAIIFITRPHPKTDAASSSQNTHDQKKSADDECLTAIAEEASVG